MTFVTSKMLGAGCGLCVHFLYLFIFIHLPLTQALSQKDVSSDCSILNIFQKLVTVSREDGKILNCLFSSGGRNKSVIDTKLLSFVYLYTHTHTHTVCVYTFINY